METVYKVLFNYFIKKNGETSLPHVMASCTMAGSTVIFVLNLLTIYTINTNNLLGHGYNKLLVIFLIVILYIAFYVLMFKVLKFKKVVDSSSQYFQVAERSKRLTWKLLIINAILLIILPLLRVYYFNK